MASWRPPVQIRHGPLWFNKRSYSSYTTESSIAMRYGRRMSRRSLKKLRRSILKDRLRRTISGAYAVLVTGERDPFLKIVIIQDGVDGLYVSYKAASDFILMVVMSLAIECSISLIRVWDRTLLVHLYSNCTKKGQFLSSVDNGRIQRMIQNTTQGKE